MGFGDTGNGFQQFLFCAGGVIAKISVADRNAGRRKDLLRPTKRVALNLDGLNPNHNIDQHTYAKRQKYAAHGDKQFDSRGKERTRGAFSRRLRPLRGFFFCRVRSRSPEGRLGRRSCPTGRYILSIDRVCRRATILRPSVAGRRRERNATSGRVWLFPAAVVSCRRRSGHGWFLLFFHFYLRHCLPLFFRGLNLNGN